MPEIRFHGFAREQVRREYFSAIKRPKLHDKSRGQGVPQCRDLAHDLRVVGMEASQRWSDYECRQLLEGLQQQGWLRLPRCGVWARAVRAGCVEAGVRRCVR